MGYVGFDFNLLVAAVACGEIHKIHPKTDNVMLSPKTFSIPAPVFKRSVLVESCFELKELLIESYVD